MISEASIALSRKNLMAFILTTYPQYKAGWVHREICARLMRFFVQVERGLSPRLILTMPPRHGKSEIVSRRFPAWALGLDPDLSFIVCSYGDDLVTRFNKDVQRIISSDSYRQIFPDTTLQEGRKKNEVAASRTSSLFEIPGYSGSFRSAGVGGGINGQGAHILSIDDPFKDRKSADSYTMRQSVHDWYTSTAYTRLAPGGGVLLTVTRWHEDDLVGRLLNIMQEPGGDQWDIINYPAIAEVDEPNRKAGEALHPARYDLAALNRIRKNIGEYDWNSLYQQRPSARGGAIFKESWLQEWRCLPKIWDQVIQSWDCTFKDGANSDNVAGQVWGKAGANFYLLDAVCEKLDFVGTAAAIRRMSAKWPEATVKIIEDKANGPAIISALKNQIPGLLGYNPGRDGKVARAYAVSPYFEAGNVFLPPADYPAPWKAAYKAELLTFPSGVHDDQVDATDQALSYLTQTVNGIMNFL